MNLSVFFFFILTAILENRRTVFRVETAAVPFRITRGHSGCAEKKKERKKEKTNSTHALQDVCMCVHLRGDLCQAGLSRHQRDLRSKRRVSSVF